jgi:two-component system CheB/CheR fusion protein
MDVVVVKPNHGADELLQLALQQFNDAALILLDTEGRVVGWLNGAEAVYGFTPDEMTGETLHRIFVPEDVELGIPEHELEVARANSKAEDDRWALRKDGARIWVAGSLVALRDEAKAVVGFAKVTRNRTELKAQFERVENELESLRIAVRSQRATLAKIAHELRNPLSAMQSAVHVIQLVAGTRGELTEAVEVVCRQIATAVALVNQLTDITQVETGKVRLHWETIELERLLEATIESCHPLIQEKKHHFRVLIPSEPIRFPGDFHCLKQVLINLVQNAAKYTEPKGNIWAKGTVEEREVVLRIEDNGIGIPSDVQPHIFELFTQVETALEKSRGGLGIGLCIVKEFVALHGGSVQVQSDGVGKGSVFTVRLPLDRAEGA